ncbi:MAG: hypothetical protein QOH36_971 [Actinomycetota bacterium]|nr:hypothetical protein [Actinomycetota bacterium]
MTPPVVDAAWVAGGVLAAAGDLVAAALTVESATDRLTAALDSGGRAASWTPPDLAEVSRSEATLEAAWAAVAATLAAGAGWDEAVVRLRVSDVETLAELGPVAPPGPAVVAHARLNAHRHAWRWPARVGRLAEVQVAADGADASFEILVLDGAAPIIDVPGGVRAACVVVLGADFADVDPSVVDRLDAAALVVAPGTDGSWLEAAVRHLACGRPLDVAVALAVPGAVIVADDGFLELTAAREYGHELLGQLRGADTPAAADAVAHLERLLESSFDADGRAGAELAAVVTSAAAAGLGDLTTVERHLQGAMANGGGGGGGRPKPPPPTGSIPESTEPSSGGGGAGDDAVGVGADEIDDQGDVDRGGDEGAAVESAPDQRRLQAQVVDPATKKVLPDRFVPGRNQVKVRIAAAVAKGAAVADVAFASPTPGREADLTVQIIAGDTLQSKSLPLPAVADSKWTKAMTIEIPAGVDRFRLFIQVLFQDRVVQSASLDRPVLKADAPAPAPAGDQGSRLAVDASTPPSAVHRMTPAGASLTIVPGLSGEPRLLRLGEKRPVDPDQLVAAGKAIRQTLLGAFRSPPANLEAAAGVLTRLAVHGSLLHQQLEADAYDDVDWIHVSTFGAADLPVELVYTHPMPDSDDLVPVCPTALAGADRCAADCPDRNRSDVVCPYGFWATSKVVERRAHTDDRTTILPGVERSINVLAVGAAGVSKKADEVDATSTARIVDAVRKAVAAGAFHPLASWSDLKSVAVLPARVLVLITHTIEGAAGDVLGTKLQLGTDDLSLHRIGRPYVNPADLEPGPVVLAIGCDTGELEASFSDYVGLLFGAGAELVVSAISPVPGKNVADFVVRFFDVLPAYLATPGIHRFGEVLTAIRRRTVATGDVLALALTATGDADVALVGV